MNISYILSRENKWEPIKENMKGIVLSRASHRTYIDYKIYPATDQSKFFKLHLICISVFRFTETRKIFLNCEYLNEYIVEYNNSDNENYLLEKSISESFYRHIEWLRIKSKDLIRVELENKLDEEEIINVREPILQLLRRLIQ